VFDEDITPQVRDALVEFGRLIGLDRLVPTEPFNRLQLDTQRKKGDACRRLRWTTYKIIAPGYEDMIKDLDLKQESASVWSTRSIEKMKSVLEIIAEKYEETEKWSDRRALIALVVPVVSFAELSIYVKGLTHFRYSAARKYASGMRPIVPEKGAGRRNRFKARNVNEFVDFIARSVPLSIAAAGS
jgi:hypothetical protein